MAQRPLVLHWHIGRESAPFDRPPYRAYFFWLEDHRIVDAADFDAAQLSKELLKRRAAGGKDLAEFEAASKALARANS